MPTVLHRLARWAETDPMSAAQMFKRDGAWEPITARQFRDRVHQLALFLESRGITAADSGCILAYNSPQWVHLDLAVLLLGCRSAGVYPNSTVKDIQYILNHTEAKVLGVQNKEYFEKLGGQLPERIKLVIVFDGDTSVSPKAVGYDAAIAEGARLAAAKGSRTMEEMLSRIDPDAGAFMIYTSGTTGSPKGALLSHDNIAFTADIAARTWKLPFAEGSLFSFLPLCHIAEKMQNVGVGISQRYTTWFCTKFDNVSKELPEVEPTLLLSVPRLWEKMMESVMGKVASGKGAKKALAEWALAVGARVADARYSGRRPSMIDLAQLQLADKLVLSKVRAAMGLRRADTLASGAAALSAHVSKWFRSLGLEILEDFGQTESTGVICMTERGVESAGTVGRAVPGLEFKIADDGEILTRGRHVFKGYFKDDAATAAALEGGWLHTGDLGELDSRGLVRIKGRKKEILKTSGGKMVAPLPIEETLKAAAIIGQVCMVGDGRKFLSALITLSDNALADYRKSHGANGAVLITDAAIVGEVKRHIDELNKSLASYEQIKRFAVISREFSIADGEMTPTLKMKRNVIEQRFRDVIDSFYAGASRD
jgi:long-chain acyl-CoA synthetase